MKKVTKRVIERATKESVSTEDLPYIISDVLKNSSNDDNIKLLNYSLSLVRKMKPVASIRIQIYDDTYFESSIGDYQYDAFMKALWKIYERLNKEHPLLTDYWVSIPPGKTDALVETVITWEFRCHEFKTRGLDADQTEAAIKATLKMLNLIESDDLRFKIL